MCKLKYRHCLPQWSNSRAYVDFCLYRLGGYDLEELTGYHQDTPVFSEAAIDSLLELCLWFKFKTDYARFPEVFGPTSVSGSSKKEQVSFFVTARAGNVQFELGISTCGRHYFEVCLQTHLGKSRIGRAPACIGEVYDWMKRVGPSTAPAQGDPL